MSLAGSVWGVPIDGVTGVPGCQAPNSFVASARRSASVMSPTTMSAALFGTKFCFQNACSWSRVMALFESAVPISMNPYGWLEPKSADTSVRCATSSGFSRCCTS